MRAPGRRAAPRSRAPTRSNAPTSASRPAPLAVWQRALADPAAGAAGCNVAGDRDCLRRRPACECRTSAPTLRQRVPMTACQCRSLPAVMLSAGTPRAASSAAITDASDGACRPTPPVGMKRGATKREPKATAASTRRTSVVLGRPPGRTAAPNITITGSGAGRADGVTSKSMPVAMPPQRSGEAVASGYHLTQGWLTPLPATPGS